MNNSTLGTFDAEGNVTSPSSESLAATSVGFWPFVGYTAIFILVLMLNMVLGYLAALVENFDRTKGGIRVPTENDIWIGFSAAWNVAYCFTYFFTYISSRERPGLFFIVIGEAYLVLCGILITVPIVIVIVTAIGMLAWWSFMAAITSCGEWLQKISRKRYGYNEETAGETNHVTAGTNSGSLEESGISEESVALMNLDEEGRASTMQEDHLNVHDETEGK